jgi:hypothetical protein
MRKTINFWKDRLIRNDVAARQRENFAMHKIHSLNIDETAWHGALEATFIVTAIAYRLTLVLFSQD